MPDEDWTRRELMAAGGVAAVAGFLTASAGDDAVLASGGGDGGGGSTVISTDELGIDIISASTVDAAYDLVDSTPSLIIGTDDNAVEVVT